MSYDHALLYKTVVSQLTAHPETSLSDLARSLKVSRRTIQATVASESGITFRAFRDLLILGKVCTLLRLQPSAAIKELAFAVGYRSPRSFARAVKRVCGASPQEVRACLFGLVEAQNDGTAVWNGSPAASLASNRVLDRVEGIDDDHTISVTLSRGQALLLKLYQEFSGTLGNDVVKTALQTMFERHGEFWAWLVQRKVSQLSDSKDKPFAIN